MTDSIDLSPSQRKTVVSLLNRYIPGITVWAYGSRVKWNSRPDSDLDLAVFATPEQQGRISALKEAFEESSLPFRVDVMVWDEVPENFRKNILEQYVVLAKRPELTENQVGKWPTVLIQDVAEKVAMGPFGSSIKVETFVPKGVPVISGQHLRGTRLEDNEYNFISHEHAEKLANANVKRGDVIFTHAGNIGQAAYIPESSRYDRYVISQRQFYLRPSMKKVLPEFVAYYFASVDGQHKLLANTSSSGVPSIAQPVSYLRTIEIPLPPIVEQRAIAHILGTLDDKIELNRRMNETLEAMARALFKSWFVDFDPVRAKNEGRDIGLPREIADLFSDSFEDSELGKIPTGWGVGPLDSVLVLQRGFDLPATQRTVGAYPVIAASGPSGTHNEFMVKGPGVTTGRSGVLGKVFYVHDDFWPLNTSLWIKEFPNSMPAYAFYLIQGIDFQLFNAGSAVPTLNRNHVHNLPTIRPPMKIIEKFESVAVSLLYRKKCCDDESSTLAAQRDTLLPKLLSGEVQINKAERFLQEAQL